MGTGVRKELKLGLVMWQMKQMRQPMQQAEMCLVMMELQSRVTLLLLHMLDLLQQGCPAAALQLKPCTACIAGVGQAAVATRLVRTGRLFTAAATVVRSTTVQVLLLLVGLQSTAGCYKLPTQQLQMEQPAALLNLSQPLVSSVLTSLVTCMRAFKQSSEHADN